LNRLIIVNNSEVGTLRGLHGQVGNSAESKIIFCVSGVFFDVILDLRKHSESFGKWSCRMIKSNQEGLIVPKGIWHGYQTLEPDTSVVYLVNGYYVPSKNISVNPFDDDLKIDWPLPVNRISKADKEGLSFRKFLEKYHPDASI
jgi:dTDP-4-dehydrorhamnose 3,5-epimerase